MKKQRPSNVQDAADAGRRAMAAELRAAQREGRVLKAATFADKRKVASKNACRKGNW